MRDSVSPQWVGLLLPAGHAQVQGDGQHRREDRKNPTHPVDTVGYGNAQLSGRPVADSRTDSAADNGPKKRNVLAASHEETCNRANNCAGDNGANKSAHCSLQRLYTCRCDRWRVISSVGNAGYGKLNNGYVKVNGTSMFYV